MADSLAVWMHGSLVARILRGKSRQLNLTYSEEALATYELGTPLLSLRLPVRPERFTRGVVKPFLDGLLPEGAMRNASAARLDLLASDTYRLTEELGRDCAGALIIVPSDEGVPAGLISSMAPVSEAELTALINNLGTRPLGIGDGVRLSLGGIQEKLLLVRRPDDSWGRPVGGTPSTHILKPGIAGHEWTVENEAFCMRLAKHLGLPVANIDVAIVDGRRLLVVERYDRLRLADGHVERIHQEDFCQALGVPPEQKYEDVGGPTLVAIAQILQTVVGGDSLEVLLRATTLNVVIGNGDAHGKNYSLLHERNGALKLAPLYDVISTIIYPDITPKLAMTIDSVHRIDKVTGSRIVNESVRWGMARYRATNIVRELLDMVPNAAAAAAGETEDAPAQLVDTVARQVKKLEGSLD